jgi:DNA primase
MLADRAGVTLADYNPREESEKERLYRVMAEAADYFADALREEAAALKYLADRGLEEKTIRDFRVGWARDDWRSLYAHLKSKGFADTEIERAGLIKKSEKPQAGERFYDRFRSRIMFPIADSSGRVIAFSGRIFGPAAENPANAKYLNSPDTPIFSKSSVLYGLDRAKDSIRKNNFAILVEGQMDLLLSHQAGFRNTVASSGTALSDSTLSRENVVSNLGLVRRLTGNIVLAYDADKAGIKAAGRAAKIALSLGMDVKAANLPDGVDPADMISKEGADAWRAAIRESKHIIEFLLEKIMKNSGGDQRKAGREIREQLLPYVASVDSAIERAHFLKKISNAAGVPESALAEDLAKAERESSAERREIEEVAEEKQEIFRKDYIRRRLLGIALFLERSSEGKKKSEELLGSLASILGLESAKMLEEAAPAKEDLIFEAEVFYGGAENLDSEARELLQNLEEECLKEKLFVKMRELAAAEGGGDKSASMNILKEINDLNAKIQVIKSGRSK